MLFLVNLNSLNLYIIENNIHKKCLICESSQIKQLNTFQRAYLSKCSKCDFVFSQRIPTTQEINAHYSNYNYGNITFISPLTLVRYENILEKLEKYRKTNRILDVGCGNGHFLSVAKKMGWDVYGTEFPDDAIKVCQTNGIKMFKGELNIQDFEENYFDIIISIEVLEHINNPIQEINKFHYLLRLGGITYLTTPNFNSLLRYRLKDKYSVINYPGHLSYYTPKTLRHLFKKCGFKVMKVETTGISMTRFKRSKGLSSQPNISVSSDDEILRNKIESKWYLGILKKLINSLLTLLGTGDSLKGYFIKQ